MVNNFKTSGNLKTMLPVPLWYRGQDKVRDEGGPFHKYGVIRPQPIKIGIGIRLGSLRWPGETRYEHRLIHGCKTEAECNPKCYQGSPGQPSLPHFLCVSGLVQQYSKERIGSLHGSKIVKAQGQ